MLTFGIGCSCINAITKITEWPLGAELHITMFGNKLYIWFRVAPGDMWIGVAEGDVCKLQ